MKFYGLLSLPWWGYIVATLILTHITIACVTMYLHRSQAHRAVNFHPVVSHFFRLWLWLTTGMETKKWVAIHRKHHAKCETEEDPHSPQVMGLSTVFWNGAELYRKESFNEETLSRYGQGTPDDWLEENIYTRYSAKGVFLMLAANLFLFGVPGITIWAIQMAWIPLFAAGVINGLGHFYGYRNYDCKDASTNLLPWGILIGGEELHNNHHTYPTSARLSNKWWEFDIGWMYIRLLSLFKLAKVKKAAPKVSLLKSAQESIDAKILSDLIANRFQVMRAYSNTVLKPAFKGAMSGAKARQKNMLAAFRAKLLGDTEIIATNEQPAFEALIGEFDSLGKAYQLKQQLLSIWSRTTASQKELIEALHEWCEAAEKSGCERLQRFSSYIRRYQLAAAF